MTNKPPELVSNGTLTAVGRDVVAWLARVYPDTLGVKPENVIDTFRADFYAKVLNGSMSAAQYLTANTDAAARLSMEYQRTIPYVPPVKESVGAPSAVGVSLAESADAPRADGDPLTEALTLPDGRLTPVGAELARKLDMINRNFPPGISEAIDRYRLLVQTTRLHKPGRYFTEYPNNTKTLLEDVAEIEQLISVRVAKEKLVAAAAQLSGK